MKWSVAATAPDQLIAEMWRDLLVEAGIPARLRPGDTTSFLGVSPVPCRILVPEDLRARAWETLSEILTPDELGPVE